MNTLILNNETSSTTKNISIMDTLNSTQLFRYVHQTIFLLSVLVLLERWVCVVKVWFDTTKQSEQSFFLQGLDNSILGP